MFYRIVVLLLINFFLCRATFSQSCNCKVNLDSLIGHVERNYSGFIEKTTGNNSGRYRTLKDSLVLMVDGMRGYDCYKMLGRYIKFFQDPHLNVLFASVGSQSNYNDTLRYIFNSFEKKSFDLDQLRKIWSNRQSDPIEGLWQALDYDFTLAIYKVDPKKGDRYIGLTVKGDNLKWFPGQVKLNVKRSGGSYKIQYFKGDHTPDSISTSIQNGEMDLGEYGRWKRIFPNPVDNNNGRTPLVSFTKLSTTTCLLTIKDAWLSNKPIIDSIVGANHRTIMQAPYLIIDLRDNGGGHIMTFDTLLPLIYTRPIVRDGLLVRASADNIALYKEALSDPSFSEKDREDFNGMIAIMEQNPNKLVKVGEGDTLLFDSQLSYPQRVGILVNKKTGSASELFLLWAKQSDKVTTFGENTKGALDYTEIGHPHSLPCPYLKFNCPMGKSEHKVYPYIDNVGIKPDVPLHYNNNDWPRVASGYLAK